ncbi:hypothetical protein [Streptomyces sp. NPDC021224]|uniref:glycine-rich domain-containing protein n=1 Tax=unclassified Streptomyces TaxID=2593676 RepID=UPI00378EC702
MTQSTTKGIIFPESTDHTRLWEHIQTAATTADAIIPGTPQVDVFTASGTWTKPAGALWVVVEVVGGGGGSGGCAATGASQAACSGAGGGGEYAKGTYPASGIGSTAAITVGAGGTAGASTPGAGGDGGTTSFGATITAAGGRGGAACSAVTAVTASSGDGGTGGTGGDVRVQGSAGGHGLVISGLPVKTCSGGGTVLGGATRPSPSASAAGSNGYTYGAGASGASNGASVAARAGASGANGVVIVTTYKA